MKSIWVVSVVFTKQTGTGVELISRMNTWVAHSRQEAIGFAFEHFNEPGYAASLFNAIEVTQEHMDQAK